MAAEEPVAHQARRRIAKPFELDAKQRQPPSTIAELHREHLRTGVEELLAFAEREREQVEDRRGSLRSALGLTVRQRRRWRAPGPASIPREKTPSSTRSGL